MLKVYKVEKNPNNKNVILLHGYGANGKDLLGLARYQILDALNFNWYFIEAPLSPPELAAFGGRAWFNLRVSDFTPPAHSQNLDEFYKMNSPEFLKSLEKVNETLWNLNLSKKTYLGGFSQGAMVAANSFLQNHENYEGLITLSGAPFNRDNWPKVSTEKKAFLSHGRQDQVLPLFCGTDLEKALLKSGLNIESHWFQGGHEIPPLILNKLCSFLSS